MRSSATGRLGGLKERACTCGNCRDGLVAWAPHERGKLVVLVMVALAGILALGTVLAGCGPDTTPFGGGAGGAGGAAALSRSRGADAGDQGGAPGAAAGAGGGVPGRGGASGQGGENGPPGASGGAGGAGGLGGDVHCVDEHGNFAPCCLDERGVPVACR